VSYGLNRILLRVRCLRITEARVAQEQTLVDAQVSTLLQLELERGMSGGNTKDAVGLAKRRQELARQQEDVQKEIAELQAKQTEQEKDLKGTKRVC
jgi:hypothetical protein